MSDRHFSHEVWLSKLRDHLTEERPAYRRCSVFQIAVHIEMDEGRKFLLGCSFPQPIEKTPCLATAMRHCSGSEAALPGHPLGVRSAHLALQNLDRRNGVRCWWPLALNQAQKHVDAIGVETQPTFVIRRMAMAAPIHPSCLFQVLLNACRLRFADVNLLLIETT